MELIEVTELGAGSTNDEEPSRSQPLSIIFRSPIDTVLPQSNYEIRHETMGALALFLVSIGPDKEGMCYEALFT